MKSLTTFISTAWRYANRAGGKCIDRVAAGYAFGGLNVIFDLIVILLPIPRMIALKVSMRQRIGYVFGSAEWDAFD